MNHVRKEKQTNNRSDSDPGPHFTNLGCVTVHVDCTWTKTAVTLRAWRDLRSSGIKLQHPIRGSFSPLMKTKSYWKVAQPLGEHAHTHTHTGIAVLLQLFIEARIAYMGRQVSNLLLNLWRVQKKKTKKKKDLRLLDLSGTLTCNGVCHLTEAPYAVSLRWMLPLTVSTSLAGCRQLAEMDKLKYISETQTDLSVSEKATTEDRVRESLRIK